MQAPRKIVLCADDYGLSPAVSRGIRELLEQRRLSATSCMVVYPEFAEDGPRLRAFRERADIGLHFTLTRDRPLSSILIAGWLRRLDRESVGAKLDEQLSRFIEVMGFPPAYLDGHQHVQLLPGVREAVVDAAKRIGAYVRVTKEPVNASLLKRPAAVDSAYLAWASGSLARMAAQNGVLMNTGFRGVRSFRETTPFRNLFLRMIEGAGNGSIVMCHPGHVDDTLRERDPIHCQREEELAYLVGEQFPDDIREAGLELSTLRAALGSEPLHFRFNTAVA